MRKKEFILAIAALLLTSALVRADFKFTQSGQLTATMLGAKAIPATVVTTYVKGSYLRIDLPDGGYGIVDLNGRRDIQIDPKNHTYSILTFVALRAGDAAYEKQVVGASTQELSGRSRFQTCNGRVELKDSSVKPRAKWR
ncbi:MAG: hypothetical protein KGM47_15445 [Acidobacteriota bacterium]|nr:hypothetical protein [Acidobacteriota bacterium]